MTDCYRGRRKPFGVPPAFLYGSFLLPLNPIIIFKKLLCYAFRIFASAKICKAKYITIPYDVKL